jgi:methylglutaconyl-CoA hydratase
MPFERLIYEATGRRARITLNRPDKRNALDDLMVRELTIAFTQAAKDSSVKVIQLAGTGSAFCAGADLEYLGRVATYDLEQNRQDSQQLASLFRLIYELRKPIIGVVNGPALAGGCGLASVCDLTVASEENARFGYTEVHIGFLAAVVMIFLVKRVGEGRARELILRGNIISATEAQTIGLVNVVVPERDLEKEVASLTESLVVNNSLISMGLSKEMLSKLDGMNLMEMLDYAANMNAAARMTPDCKEGIASFLARKNIEW